MSLIALDNQLKFAYGELSRLGGLPGGVFIQLKQAGAATQNVTTWGWWIRCRWFTRSS